MIYTAPKQHMMAQVVTKMSSRVPMARRARLPPFFLEDLRRGAPPELELARLPEWVLVLVRDCRSPEGREG